MIFSPVFFRKDFISKAPLNLLNSVDSKAPFWLKRKLLEPHLDEIFGGYIESGDFAFLEDRFISLKLTDFQFLITLTLNNDKLTLSDSPGEVTISGGLRTFLQLARKEVDADGLFFQRKLLIEGDTELGLGVRNLLDGLDWSIEESKLGMLCCRLADFRQAFTRRKSAFN